MLQPGLFDCDHPSEAEMVPHCGCDGRSLLRNDVEGSFHGLFGYFSYLRWKCLFQCSSLCGLDCLWFLNLLSVFYSQFPYRIHNLQIFSPILQVAFSRSCRIIACNFDEVPFIYFFPPMIFLSWFHTLGYFWNNIPNQSRGWTWMGPVPLLLAPESRGTTCRFYCENRKENHPWLRQPVKNLLSSSPVLPLLSMLFYIPLFHRGFFGNV